MGLSNYSAVIVEFQSSSVPTQQKCPPFYIPVGTSNIVLVAGSNPTAATKEVKRTCEVTTTGVTFGNALYGADQLAGNQFLIPNIYGLK